MNLAVSDLLQNQEGKILYLVVHMHTPSFVKLILCDHIFYGLPALSAQFYDYKNHSVLKS